jgi:hypothetical protein
MLLALVAAGYFAVNVGEAYLRYFRYQDAMQQEARFSPQKSDTAIQRTLRALADSLGLPPEAQRLRIRRAPGRFTVSADYLEAIHLPLIVRDFHFHPSAEYVQ